MISKDAIFADDRMSMSEEVAAYLNSGVKHDVWQQRGVRSEPHLWTHDDVSANMGAGSNLSRGIDDRSRVNPRRIGWRPVEEAKRTRERQIRVLDAQSSG